MTHSISDDGEDLRGISRGAALDFKQLVNDLEMVLEARPCAAGVCADIRTPQRADECYLTLTTESFAKLSSTLGTERFSSFLRLQSVKEAGMLYFPPTVVPKTKLGTMSNNEDPAASAQRAGITFLARDFFGALAAQCV
jgi:hypothetical protein